MNQNRFERVDEAVDDAMTLSLKREDEKFYGVVTCPASAAADHLPRDFVSDQMPLTEAIRSAVRLANAWKVALVVHDPDGLWQSDWGTLYRDDDEDPRDP